jgi:transposase
MNYKKIITESEDYLISLEHQTKDLKARDRVRFIRYLKSGEAITQKQAGKLIGLQERQSQRLWKTYREAGIGAMSASNYLGGQSKLSEAQQTELEERLKQDDIWSLEQARDYIEQEYAVSYTIGGLSYLFKRMKVKLKTGRPSNIRQKAEEKENFKKKDFPS